MLLIAVCNAAAQDALGYERGARRSFSYTRRPLSTAPLITAPATPVADPNSHANPLYGQEGERCGLLHMQMCHESSASIRAGCNNANVCSMGAPLDLVMFEQISSQASNESELQFPAFLLLVLCLT